MIDKMYQIFLLQETMDSMIFLDILQVSVHLKLRGEIIKY